MTQSDGIFVAMDAAVRIYEDDLIPTRSVTVMKYPYALAHVSLLSSIFARQKMRMKSSKSKMTASIWMSSTPVFYFFESSASWLRLWLPASGLTFHVNFCRASHEWSQEWERARTNLLVVSKNLCFRAPRLVRTDELHILEVQ